MAVHSADGVELREAVQLHDGLAVELEVEARLELGRGHLVHVALRPARGHGADRLDNALAEARHALARDPNLRACAPAGGSGAAGGGGVSARPARRQRPRAHALPRVRAPCSSLSVRAFPSIAFTLPTTRTVLPTNCGSCEKVTRELTSDMVGPCAAGRRGGGLRVSRDPLASGLSERATPLLLPPLLTGQLVNLAFRHRFRLEHTTQQGPRRHQTAACAPASAHQNVRPLISASEGPPAMTRGPPPTSASDQHDAGGSPPTTRHRHLLTSAAARP